MHGKHLQSLTLLMGIFDLLPPLCWDLRLLGLIEPCLCPLGLICASFYGTTKFLSTSAISGSSSPSWAFHASMIVLNGQVDFWIINLSRICNCVMYPHV